MHIKVSQWLVEQLGIMSWPNWLRTISMSLAIGERMLRVLTWAFAFFVTYMQKREALSPKDPSRQFDGLAADDLEGFLDQIDQLQAEWLEQGVPKIVICWRTAKLIRDFFTSVGWMTIKKMFGNPARPKEP
jgi:hypothetical protein